MVDVNAMVGPPQGRLIKPVERTIIDMFMALELKR
jgi:hypothetical protein